jgi:hypothetical protein
MNRKWMIRIGVSLLVLAGLAVVAGVAFRAGRHHDDVRELVIGDDGVRSVVVDEGWRHGGPGFGFGFGFGFLFFPLLIVCLILLFSARRGGWGGPWRSRDEELRQWHERAHADLQAQASQPAQPPEPPQPPPPPAPQSEA